MIEHTAYRAAGLVGLLAALLVPPACPAAGDGPGIVAVYRGGTVTRAEYESWLAYRRAPRGEQATGSEIAALALRKALAAALPQEIRASPETLFRLRGVEERVLADAWRADLARRITVSEEDVAAALVAMDDDRRWPRRLLVYNLSKLVPEGATEAEREIVRGEIWDLHRRLLDGADFAELARLESDSETRFRGGRMGILEAGVLPATLDEVVFALSAGEISDPVETPTAFVLFYCARELEARTLTLEESEARVRGYLRRRAFDRAWREAVAAIETAIQVVPREELEGLEATSEAVVASSPAGTVSARELAWSLAAAPDELDGSVDVSRAERLLRARLTTAGAAARAREIGLDARPEVRGSLLWRARGALAEIELPRRVQATSAPPTEAELRAWIAARPERFRHPETYAVDAIRLAAGNRSPGPIAVARRLAEELSIDPTGFEAAAEAHSDLPYPAAPGHLGSLSRKQLAAFGPAVLGTVVELEAGRVGGPVQGDGGLWILRWTEHRGRRPMTLPEALPLAEREWKAHRAREARTQALERARAELDVRILALP